MRLGLIGPTTPEALRKLAGFLVNDVQAERIVYLGVDGALDDYVQAQARQIVGGDANEAAMWLRAATLCKDGTPARIDEFLQSQEEREALRVFESLDSPMANAVELLGGKLTLLTYDKANWEAEDMLPAAFLVFGKSPERVGKQIGVRWFLSPGAGAVVLDDAEEPVRAVFYDDTLQPVEDVRLHIAHSVQLKISG